MTNLNIAGLNSSPSTWQAQLELEFVANDRGTRLVKNSHIGPLYVQRPFYPEGKAIAHVYVLHPPGGLVSGDQLTIKVLAGADSHALITTPGAGRVYRARADFALQHQSITIDVEENAVLEWLPLETIIFNGAHTRLDTEISLAKGAKCFAWDITSLGLPANSSSFELGRIQQCIKLNVEGVPVVLERLLLNPEERNPFAEIAGFNQRPVNGIFLAGPFDALAEEDVQRLRDTISSEGEASYLAGVTLVNRFIVGRYLGSCTEQGRNLFSAWWEILRPLLLKRNACSPRIWST